MTDNHAPQTFEEWWAKAAVGRHYDSDLAGEAWDAGVASQQAEISDLLRSISWLMYAQCGCLGGSTDPPEDWVEYAPGLWKRTS